MLIESYTMNKTMHTTTQHEQATGNLSESCTPSTKARKERPYRRYQRKQRPKDVPGIIAALNDGSINLRHPAAKDAITVRDALAAQPREVAAALVRGALALDAVIMQRIQAEVLRPDTTIVDADGNLHPLLVTHWPDIRGGIMRGSKTLAELDKRAASTANTGTGGGIADIILASEAEGNEQG